MKEKKLVFILVLLAILYVLIGSFVVYRYQHTADENLFDLKFLYGPIVKNIVENRAFTIAGFVSYRMPFLPIFLSTIAFIYNNLIFAYLIKNFIFSTLVFASIYVIWKNTGHLNRYILFVAGIYALSFPQLVLHGFAIEYEAGYAIPFISILFANLLYAEKIKKKWMFSALAVINCVMFFTQRSMLLLSFMISFFYYWATGNRKVFFTFFSALLTSFMLWGFINLQNTGRFTIFSSLNGYDFYKGNNEFVLSVYPDYDLDLISGKISEGAPKGDRIDRWAIDRYYKNKALDFIKNHPLEWIKLTFVKFYAFFLKIANPIDENSKKYGLLMKLGMAYMLTLRVIFILCLLFAVDDIIKRKGKKSAIYIAFIVAFSAPYMLAFGHERHFTPLIPAILMYFVWYLGQKRQFS